MSALLEVFMFFFFFKNVIDLLGFTGSQFWCLGSLHRIFVAVHGLSSGVAQVLNVGLSSCSM